MCSQQKESPPYTHGFIWWREWDSKVMAPSYFCSNGKCDECTGKTYKPDNLRQRIDPQAGMKLKDCSHPCHSRRNNSNWVYHGLWHKFSKWFCEINWYWDFAMLMESRSGSAHFATRENYTCYVRIIGVNVLATDTEISRSQSSTVWEYDDPFSADADLHKVYA